MIDVHSHIVFDVDDGPKTLEESLDLIGESYAQGVRKIVSTSHRRKGMFETPEDKIFTNFSKVKAEAEALYPDLTIYYGGELYYTSDIVEKLEKNLIPRMHNTQFALIEFSARTSWKEIHSSFFLLFVVITTYLLVGLYYSMGTKSRTETHLPQFP